MDKIVEKAMREKLKRPKREITEADLERVVVLALSWTKLTDEGLKDVAKLQNLEQLSLYDTKITDAGLKDLAKLQSLRDVDFHKTKVTKAGKAEFKKALPNCEINGP